VVLCRAQYIISRASGSAILLRGGGDERDNRYLSWITPMELRFTYAIFRGHNRSGISGRFLMKQRR
jgi:hypothetical protein